jgi:hypothetical protein
MVNTSSKSNSKFHPFLDNTTLCKFSNEALHIFHQNIQGLQLKIDEIINILYPELPQVLCFTEHHLNQIDLNTIYIDKYTLGSSYCRHYLHKRGSCIFVQDILNFVSVDLNKFSSDRDIEAYAILLTNSGYEIYIQWNLDASFPLPSFSCIDRLPYLVPELAPYK